MRQPVFGSLLQRVSHGVAGVQDRAAARLALVFATTSALISTLRRTRCSRVAGSRRTSASALVSIQPKYSRSAISPCFTASASPRAVFAVRQGSEHQRVGYHRDRRVEGADEVLALGGVHSGLAAHRGVQHREQGGRYLEERDAAHVGRGDESGEVAGDAAAQRHERAVAAEALTQQRVGEPAQVSRVLHRSPAGKVRAVPSHRASASRPSRSRRDTDLVGDRARLAGAAGVAPTSSPSCASTPGSTYTG